MAAHAVFNEYLTTIEGRECYMAGLPSYPRNFSRDTFLAGILAADSRLLENQLIMSRAHQGTDNTPSNGEEYGKIHHEYPGVVFRKPYVTTYDACDATPLYLIALEGLWHNHKTAAQEFIEHNRPSIDAALDYLQNHITEDIFWEYPPPPVERFSLRMTYWKDSIVPNATHGEEPVYPITFALVQFQVARALLAAGRLLERPELTKQADRMFRIGIQKCMRADAFQVAQDSRSIIEEPSSDELHALAYLPTEYGSSLPLKAMMKRAAQLITPAGFACIPRPIDRHLTDHYHGYVVWIFEQAFIHYGAHKFGISHLGAIAKRCVPHIGDGQELLAVEPNIQPLGNHDQLWSVAAKLYFSDKPSLRNQRWL